MHDWLMSQVTCEGMINTCMTSVKATCKGMMCVWLAPQITYKGIENTVWLVSQVTCEDMIKLTLT